MSQLTFTKRNNIISVSLEGNHIGSASYIKYDDDTALIQYIYVENYETNLNNFRELVSYVEACIKESGFHHVYLLADEEDLSIYFDLGYLRAVKEPDLQILTKLLGVTLTNFVSLIKHLNH